jgi:hypothetical protein
MPDRKLAPAINGVEERLDMLNRSIERLIDVLTPAPESEPKADDSIELREQKPSTSQNAAKRRKSTQVRSK